MELFRKIVNGPARWLHVVGCVVTVLMMLHIVADVIAKHLFDSPIDGTLEIVAAYYMVVIVFIPLAYVTKNEGHILVELFTRGLSKRGIAAFDGVMGIFTLVFMLIVTWKTLEDALRATDEGDVWETGGALLDVWPSHWLLPFGFTVMTGYVIIRMIDDLRAASTPNNNNNDG